MNTRTRQTLIAAAVATAVAVPAGAVVAATAHGNGHGRMQSTSGMPFQNRMDPDDMGGGMMSGAGSGAAAGMGMDRGMSGMYVADEFGYLAQMIPHHEEAIAAAKQLLARTDRAEMKTFAQSIISTQSAEVKQLKAYLSQWYAGMDTTVSYTPMMRDLGGLSGDALDRAFLEDMIPHHHMAVMMSQQLLTRDLATHPDVSALATSIRDGQTTEIHTMTGWLDSWFGVKAGMGMMRG